MEQWIIAHSVMVKGAVLFSLVLALVIFGTRWSCRFVFRARLQGDYNRFRAWKLSQKFPSDDYRDDYWSLVHLIHRHPVWARSLNLDLETIEGWLSVYHEQFISCCQAIVISEVAQASKIMVQISYWQNHWEKSHEEFYHPDDFQEWLEQGTLNFLRDIVKGLDSVRKLRHRLSLSGEPLSPEVVSVLEVISQALSDWKPDLSAPDGSLSAEDNKLQEEVSETLARANKVADRVTARFELPTNISPNEPVRVHPQGLSGREPVDGMFEEGSKEP